MQVLPILVFALLVSNVVASYGSDDGRALQLQQPSFIGKCMQDNFQLVGGSTSDLTCSAKEVELQSLTATIDGACIKGEYTTLTLQAVVQLNAARYDMGWYIALDGGNGLTGTCAISPLLKESQESYSLSGGAQIVWNADVKGGNDVCGDIMDATTMTVSNFLYATEILCEDSDNDGLLDTVVCFSWRVPGSDSACDPSALYPGTPSKCACVDPAIVSNVVVVEEPSSRPTTAPTLVPTNAPVFPTMAPIVPAAITDAPATSTSTTSSPTITTGTSQKLTDSPTVSPVVEPTDAPAVLAPVASPVAPPVSDSTDCARRRLGSTFAWNIMPVSGFPIVAFDEAHQESSVEFKYAFTGALTDNKSIQANLFREDCATPADSSLTLVESIEGSVLTIDVGMDEKSILSSTHAYTSMNKISAEIRFCIRVDYVWVTVQGKTESINFHETALSVHVDLKENFEVPPQTPTVLESRLLHRQLQDFAWDIAPSDGFPTIAFDSESSQSEVKFEYVYAGTLSENKFLQPTIFQEDCITPADSSLAFSETLSSNKLSLDLNIVQETITDSVHYTSLGDFGQSAEINFCVRVDYNYKDSDGTIESINFHETVVTISVDLTANFSLTSIATDRLCGDNADANAALDYPVQAYFCDEVNEQENPGTLVQGSSLQVCVKMDDSVKEDVYVSDVFTFVVSQPDGPASSSTSIAETVADALTAKDCISQKDGVCNIKTQLPSKFFSVPNPSDLRVDGVAILAFGVPARRLVAVPIQQSLQKGQAGRGLQDNGDGPASDFQLEVGLATNSTTAEEKGGGTVFILLTGAATVIVLVVGLGIWRRKRGALSHDEEEANVQKLYESQSTISNNSFASTNQQMTSV